MKSTGSDQLSTTTGLVSSSRKASSSLELWHAVRVLEALESSGTTLQCWRDGGMRDYLGESQSPSRTSPVCSCVACAWLKRDQRLAGLAVSCSILRRCKHAIVPPISEWASPPARPQLLTRLRPTRSRLESSADGCRPTTMSDTYNMHSTTPQSPTHSTSS